MKKAEQRIFSTLLITVFLTAALSASAAEKTTSSAIVDISTATQSELEALPGIGPSKAKAIIEHRNKRPFNKVEDLMKVKGIGRKTYKKLLPRLTVTASKKPAK